MTQTTSSAVRHLRGNRTMKITCTALVLLIQTIQCLASDDSWFTLTNKDTGFCLVKRHDYCFELAWTTGDRILVHWLKKCLGAQGKSVGSEISLYDCDETSELQKWECRNGTVLALKDQELYIELTADNTAVLSKTTGPNNHLTIRGTSSGACTRTYREHYTIEGNANGRPCMFPFQYKDRWFESCTDFDSSNNRLWCAVETKYQSELWGYCPTTSKQHWKKNLATGAYYQLNTHSALTWPQAETSCKQQGASLLSITDPHEQAYVIALLGTAGRGQGDKLWNGLILDPQHGWQWSNGRPFRYLNWDSGHPLPNPGHNCAIVNGAVQFSWQSSTCTQKLGYICYSKGAMVAPTEAAQTGFCSRPWIPYNGHCFLLNRTQKTWSDAQRECRKEGGDLVSIGNVEDQSFVISQLGYESTDELWIGLNDRSTERLFDWSDHSTVSFTSWEFGKPAVSTDQEDCVLIRGENGNWADRVCNEKHGFICMKTSASEPSGHEAEQNLGCKTGWKRHGSYCYFVGTQMKTFDEAKEDCKSSDSYLADVTNGVDNAFLVSLVGLRAEKHFWIGLSNQKHIDEFVWTNGNPVRFTHWNAEMPGYQQGCVAMTTGIFAGLWDVLPCTNMSKYICKHQAEGASITPAPPTVLPPKCPTDWNQIISRKYCYKYFVESSNRKTWYDARDYCRAIGGDLLSIHSAAEQHFRGRRYGSVWIGLSAPDPSTGYVWSDGSAVNYQQWENGEPNNKNNVESCVEMRTFWHYRSGWGDVQCEKPNGWICQILAGVTPKPPPDPVTPDYNTTSDGWLEWNGNQYYFNHQRIAMEEARDFCQQRHGDLVTINSEAESAFLWKQISTDTSYWIGLRVDLDRTFEWMDGSPVVYQRWSEGQPDFKNYDENCAVMGSATGFWHDYNCGYEHKSICKRSNSPAVNATVTPKEAPKGGCPPDWKKMKSKCYRIITDQKSTWDEGRKQCQAMGGDLASISSRHVEVFLMSEMVEKPTTDIWIGLRSVNGEAYFWSDGQPRKYYNLNYNQIHFPGMIYPWILQQFYSPGVIYPLRLTWKSCVAIHTNTSFGFAKWIVKPCNDTTGFVCIRNVDPSLPDSPEPTSSTDYVRVINDSMKVVTQKMTWDAAKKHCEDDGAKLTSLRNQWSQAYVELLAFNLKAPLWIGLNRMQTDGYFRFIDGWHLSFTHWARNEPSRDRPCVYVDVDRKWKTADCNQTMNSVCIKSTDVPPTQLSAFPGVCPEDPDILNTGRTDFWRPFKGHCYMFFTESLRWADASVRCVSHGGSLASIEDPSEQEFIQNNIRQFQDSHVSFWIGLFKTHKGQWSWLDGTLMDYTNWAESPNNGRDSHGGISSFNGMWTAAYPNYYRPYICKTHKVPQQTTSPSATVLPTLHHRGHIALVAVLVITVIATGAAIAFFLFKKKGRRLAILDKLTTFENPLFFSNGQSQPGETNAITVVENPEEENSNTIITI